jgi:hypothetical protein
MRPPGQRDLRVLLEPRFAEAVAQAARRQFQSLSAYTRRALLAQMQLDGIVIDTDADVASQFELDFNDEPADDDNDITTRPASMALANPASSRTTTSRPGRRRNSEHAPAK